MSERHEHIARWLAKGRQNDGFPFANLYCLWRNDASDLLDEWEDAQKRLRWQGGHIRALELRLADLHERLAAVNAPPAPPAWAVVA